MKLKGIVLLSLSAALVIIGTHLTMTQGITTSYPVFMFAVTLLFWYKYLKTKWAEQADDTERQGDNKKKRR
ncbi:hypothetical protein DN752_10480 [Echinicola strongylocentroti]|uniref:Uncharacterized protein n=1 Tax=Echinicola strongylocentroti TaxID=1795355 RepID=A0A2Z4IIZ8_9BACT|nr:hypothetical protein [Echinicola strongylocentroti]AWW30516.1 hypothetical protein DN752_10480 [Echinicola strongylocentroti]